MGEFSGAENIIKQEKEEKPRYRLMVSRHAERLPSGSLSSEGIEFSRRKGVKIGEATEVLKGYASDEKTKRTSLTSDLVSESSGIISPLTKKQYKTHIVEDIQYSVFNPDLTFLLERGKKITDEATIKELGLPEGTILEELSQEEQIKIAPIRQKNQELGFKSLFDYPEAIHRMAIGLAHQLIHEIKLFDRYKKIREKNKPLEKDAILNTISHGMFFEALFLEAGYIKDEKGALSKIDRYDFEDPNFGGLIMPSESFFLEIKDPQGVPDKIPVSFERRNRPKEGVIFIDKNRLLKLAEEYEEWKEK